MRISDTVVTGTVRSNLQRSFAQIHRFQNQLSTGTVIQNPSDDPAGASRSLLLRSDIRNGEQYQRNINEGVGHMNFVDSVLDSLVNAVIDMRGIAIQGASDTVNAGDRDILAQEVNGMIEFVLGLSQSKFRGEFVFAGTETGEIPYTAVRDANGDATAIGRSIRHSKQFSDRTTATGTLLALGTPPNGLVTIGVGGTQPIALDLSTDSLDDIKAKIDGAGIPGVTVSIVESTSNAGQVFRLKIDGTTTLVDNNNVLSTLGIGNVDTTGSITRAVGDGVKVQINTPGQNLFEGAQNPFTALVTLRDALRNNNVTEISQSITDLEVARKKISNARGVLGARTSRIELERGLLERFEVNLTATLSGIEDVDFAEAVLNLQRAQSIFQAALISGQTVNQPTLLDFLA
ncbi:MAG: flagellar hook-associated protein FlgL [bacterium]|nr:flagellar hook-associated protein FlgL [bacterium]